MDGGDGGWGDGECKRGFLFCGRDVSCSRSGSWIEFFFGRCRVGGIYKKDCGMDFGLGLFWDYVVELGVGWEVGWDFSVV